MEIEELKEKAGELSMAIDQNSESHYIELNFISPPYKESVEFRSTEELKKVMVMASVEKVSKEARFISDALRVLLGNLSGEELQLFIKNNMERE